MPIDVTPSLPAGAEPTPTAGSTPADASLPASIGRYRIEGEIARGGMGVVLRASDPDFGRTLAVKVLLDHRRDDEGAVRRFLDEARLCGQLQHPGIPPVHEMGTLPDGRPYFAMKLVKGDTLAALLDRRAYPTEDLPRWLSIFEQVCQTVAYAHSREVLHRDLKPSNVMVGAFGEVQVMDWGLAKVLGGESPPSESAQSESSTLYTTRAPGSPELTAPGSVLGTPAFMPPEQARGQVDHLDERADVFALGAMLCVILTGQPPYAGEDGRPVRQRAEQGDLAAARSRLAGCGADGELVQLTLACLAFQPSERPRDAAAVAQAIAAHRAGVEQRLRQAEIARAQAEVQSREERKRRRVLLGLAAAVVLFVTAAAAGLLWWQQDRHARLTQTRSKVEPALGEAERLSADARQIRRDSMANASSAEALWGQARAAIGRAETALETGLADDDLRRRVDEARAAVAAGHAEAVKTAAFLAALDEAREHGTTWHSDTRVAREAFAKAFRDYGRDMATDSDAAAWVKTLPDDVREAALIALYEWWTIAAKDRRHLWTLLENADDDDWRRRFRNAVDQRDLARLRGLAGEPRRQSLPAINYLLLAGTLRGLGTKEEAVGLLRGARLKYREDFLISTVLGLWLSGPDVLRPSEVELEEAVGCLRTAVAVRPQSPMGLAFLGFVLRRQHKLDEAVAAIRQAIEINPRIAMVHVALGEALRDQKKLDEAVAAFRQAVAIDPRIVPVYRSLGEALRDQKKLDEAVVAYRQAVAIDPRYDVAWFQLGEILARQGKPDEAVVALSKSIEFKPDDPVAHFYLGNAFSKQKKLDEAVTAYRKAIALKPDYTEVYINLGAALYRQKKVEEAVAAFRKAIELKPDDPVAHFNLGNAFVEQHKLDEAVTAYRKAIELKRDYAVAYNNLGIALHSQKKVEEAVAAYREAIELDPTNARFHDNLGRVLADQNRLDEAVAAFRKAIAFDPRNANTFCSLGGTLRRQNQLDEAVDAYRKAIRLRPTYAEAHCDLGSALLLQGKFAEGLESRRRGHELGSHTPDWKNPSAIWVRHAERLVELDSRLPALLEGREKPAGPDEMLELAFLCKLKRQYGAAVRFYTEAFAAEPKRPDNLRNRHRYNAACSAALVAAGQGKDAPADAPTRAELRRRALAWLRDDLAAWTKLLQDGNAVDRQAVQEMMRHWQTDVDLSGVRHPWSLLRLPAEERRQWQRLWADVDALQQRAAGTK
jgi:tetratricopeptide (TPR) repeat protein